MRRLALVVLAVLASAPLRSHAQEPAPAAEPVATDPVVEVVLKSGARVRAVVLERDERRLRVRETATNETRAIPFSRIDRVDETGERVAAPAPDAVGVRSAAKPAALLGIGVAVPAGGDTGPAALYFPIQASRGFRLEPALGFEHANGENTVLLGLGLYATRDVAPAIRFYVGPRAEARLGDAPGGAVVGAALGGEWVPTPRVALGAEGRIDAAFGDLPDVGGTSGLLFVRVFVR